MADKHINKVVFGGEVLVDLTADTVDTSHLLKGATAHDRSGAPITGACDYDADTSDATAAAAEVLTGKTAYVAGAKVTGTMPNNGGVSGTITTKAGQYTIPQGYHDGSGKVGISATEQQKLVPNNIRNGVTILGVEGTMSGREAEKPQAKTVTPTTSQQVVTPDSGYTCLSQVTVEKIPYAESDNAQGGKTVTIG